MGDPRENGRKTPEGIWIPESSSRILTPNEYWRGIFESMSQLSRIRTGSPAGFPIVAKGTMGPDRMPATAEFFPFDPFENHVPTFGVINYQIDSIQGVLVANAMWSGDKPTILGSDGKPRLDASSMRALHLVSGFIQQEINDIFGQIS